MSNVNYLLHNKCLLLIPTRHKQSLSQLTFCLSTHPLKLSRCRQITNTMVSEPKSSTVPILEPDIGYSFEPVPPTVHLYHLSSSDPAEHFPSISILVFQVDFSNVFPRQNCVCTPCFSHPSHISRCSSLLDFTILTIRDGIYKS
jgi:hypothetical protein